MKDPAVLFYTSDFITGTLTMTDAQRGKYIMLLCLQHQQGFLTEQDMLNVCKSYDEKIFSKFDKDQMGYYYNERMKIESEKRNKHCEKQRDRIKKYWDEKNKENEYRGTSLIGNKPDDSLKKNIPLINENENENMNIIEELYNNVVILFDENCRPKTDLQKIEWCDTLDKLIRIDGHSSEHIQNIIKRTRMDDFWRTNFLSVLKLRKKNKEGIPYFTVFEKKMDYQKKNNTPIVSPPSPYLKGNFR